jgi:hypothetical protein
MKYLIGFAGAIITMVVLKLLVDYVNSEFIIGWLCSIGYYIARDAYEEFKS